MQKNTEGTSRHLRCHNLKKKVARMDESIPPGILAIIFDGGRLVAVFLSPCCDRLSNDRGKQPLKSFAGVSSDVLIAPCE
jgi:hypothetical protein